MQDLSGLDEMVSVLQSRQLALLVILTAACTSYLLSTWMTLGGKNWLNEMNLQAVSLFFLSIFNRLNFFVCAIQ